MTLFRHDFPELFTSPLLLLISILLSFLLPPSSASCLPPLSPPPLISHWDLFLPCSSLPLYFRLLTHLLLSCPGTLTPVSILTLTFDPQHFKQNSPTHTQLQFAALVLRQTLFSQQEAFDPVRFYWWRRNLPTLAMIRIADFYVNHLASSLINNCDIVLLPSIKTEVQLQDYRLKFKG